MKNLYLIGGTMGVGKTTACRILKGLLPRAVFLDGDWCWDAEPFVVTEETKGMVTDNICHLLNNFIHCTEYENIIFCWVMHRQEIIDSLLQRLDTGGCRVISVSLVCGEETLRNRLSGDVERGARTADVIERSVPRLGLYRELDTVKLDVTGLTAHETAGKLAELGED